MGYRNGPETTESRRAHGVRMRAIVALTPAKGEKTHTYVGAEIISMHGPFVQFRLNREEWIVPWHRVMRIAVISHECGKCEAIQATVCIDGYCQECCAIAEHWIESKDNTEGEPM